MSLPYLQCYMLHTYRLVYTHECISQERPFPSSRMYRHNRTGLLTMVYTYIHIHAPHHRIYNSGIVDISIPSIHVINSCSSSACPDTALSCAA